MNLPFTSFHPRVPFRRLRCRLPPPRVTLHPFLLPTSKVSFPLSPVGSDNSKIPDDRNVVRAALLSFDTVVSRERVLVSLVESRDTWTASSRPSRVPGFHRVSRCYRRRYGLLEDREKEEDARKEKKLASFCLLSRTVSLSFVIVVDFVASLTDRKQCYLSFRERFRFLVCFGARYRL